MHPLTSFAGNVTSQSGEDGILAETFSRIGVAYRTCVEFGAWDGQHLSNTWSLWHEQGWRAVLIEGDAQRHAALLRSLTGFPGVNAVCAYVRSKGENSLDNLLGRAEVQEDFDLLSIDVDGDDYHIWRGMTRFRPRVVVIEYNPTIPPGLELVQTEGRYFGASARALVSLAERKGYRLAYCTDTNCVFVAATCWDALGIGDVALEDAICRRHLTYVISSYGGETYLTQTPTYAALPSAGFGALLGQLRLALSPPPPRAQVEGECSLVPVRMLNLAATTSWRQAVRGALGSVWRRFAATRIGAPFAALRNRWLARKAIAAWESAGRPVPPPHAYKQRVLRDCSRAHGARVMVETGTYLGDMLEALREDFGQVYSIELDRELHERAVRRFAGRRNVSILCGDSATVLPRLLDSISHPALFWLDGHFSAGITARGDKDTPVVAELEAIARHPVRGHVVLIDDARCFDGSHDYPSLQEIREFASRHWPDHTFEVKDDIIRILPRR